MKTGDKIKRISCPFCSEKILADAKKCRFCGEWMHKKDINVTEVKTKKRNSKLLILIVIFIIGTIYYLIRYYNTINNSPTLNDEEGLRQTVNRQYLLLKSESGGTAKFRVV